jgi:EAL domain-containing protein (putative c-di-GMP-specific phosphodiesterase class I)
VVLEITERASLDGVKDPRGRVARLRDMGFRIAVDDLGAGFAGLSTLAHLEPEVVKIDMSLVRNAHESVPKQRIIRSLVRLFDEMGLETVVEGVETAMERDCLLELGCDLCQGYLFGRPAFEFQTPPPGAWPQETKALPTLVTAG